MKPVDKKVKEYLKPAIITALIIFALSFLTNPIAEILDSLIADFSETAIKIKILRLWVGLLIVLIGLLSYIIMIYKKFNYKRLYRFGVYWHKVKPYCPYCGGKLIQPPLVECFDCTSCKERIIPWDFLKNYPPKIKDILEIIRKET